MVLQAGLLASCSSNNDEYFPLDQEIRWEYQINKYIGQENMVGKSIIMQLPTRKIDNIYYYPFIHANGEKLYYYKDESAVWLTGKPGRDAITFLPVSLEPGVTWQQPTRIELLTSRHESFSGGESFISQDEEVILTSQISSLNDVVTVPAGRFNNTMRIESKTTVTVKERTRGIDAISIVQTSWFARGVGLIKQKREEFSLPEKYHGTQIIELIGYKYN